VKRNLPVFSAGVIVGSIGALMLQSLNFIGSEDEEESTTRDASSGSEKHPVDVIGEPVIDPQRRRSFGNFVVSYSTLLRIPLWVCERLNRKSVTGDADRKLSSGFAEDPLVDELFRAPNEAYRASGYDRGHLAPAMDFYSSQSDMNNTFFLSNVVPQNRSMNREFWARTEKFSKDLAKRHEDVFIVTGPLFLPQPIPASDGSMPWPKQRASGPPALQMRFDLLGAFPRNVAVPTGLWKVILTKDGSRYSAAAFAMPNASIASDTPLERFAVPLQQLEAVTGLRFFPDVLGPQSHAREQLEQSERKFFRRRQLKSGETEQQQQLLLPMSQSNTDSKQEQSSVRIPMAKSAENVKANHLCANEACELPRERFWERSRS
jgi:DNA/RNA endonuclease G (NUC1)